MAIKIGYRVEGEDRIALGGCADFSLEMLEEAGRRTVRLVAKRDLTLLSYKEDAPEHFSGRHGPAPGKRRCCGKAR